jgi:hypothetical protein
MIKNAMSLKAKINNIAKNINYIDLIESVNMVKEIYFK